MNTQTDAMQRMTELVSLLKKASEAYYAHDEEIMSNYEYDRLYDELQRLEEETQVTLAGSPTLSVGYEAVDTLPKERHAQPMLSLDKTKSREDLRGWLGTQKGLLSWKLDGLTIVLTYREGELSKAVTRGNGEVGEVITPNAKVFENLPLRIPFKGELILRGEAVIRYSDFEKINATLPEGESVYKNPRNLCSGSVRQLSNEITARRHVRFYAFSLVKAYKDAAENNEEAAQREEEEFGNSREKEFLFLKEQGFDVVEYYPVTEDNIADCIHTFEEKIADYDLPSDGLVLLLDDIAYGESLGRTAKFPRNSIAFKWADDTRETVLREVEWSASRTGLINPVAVFDPVELEGTTVQRASVHNVSIVRALKLGIGDHLMVYKANMIIPQIAENLTKSGTLQIPERCPVCGSPAVIRDENGVQTLYCLNEDCTAKKIKSFTLFVSRNAMNIDGLSEMTLEKFIAEGFIHEFADIYKLSGHRERICAMEGFGEKSYENLMTAIDASRRTTLRRVLTALGIPGIGSAGARLLCIHFQDHLEAMLEADAQALAEIDGVGPVLAENFSGYFQNEKNLASLRNLMAELTLTQDESTAGAYAEDTGSAVLGKTFVITGSLHHYENRDALKAVIEARGGKVAGSVSKKTDYLINNDPASQSSKNKKATEVGTKIITEDEFVEMLEG